MYYPGSYAGIQNLFVKIGKASLLNKEKAFAHKPIFHYFSFRQYHF